MKVILLLFLQLASSYGFQKEYQKGDIEGFKNSYLMQAHNPAQIQKLKHISQLWYSCQRELGQSMVPISCFELLFYEEKLLPQESFQAWRRDLDQICIQRIKELPVHELILDQKEQDRVSENCKRQIEFKIRKIRHFHTLKNPRKRFLYR